MEKDASNNKNIKLWTWASTVHISVYLYLPWIGLNCALAHVHICRTHHHSHSHFHFKSSRIPILIWILTLPRKYLSVCAICISVNRVNADPWTERFMCISATRVLERICARQSSGQQLCKIGITQFHGHAYRLQRAFIHSSVLAVTISRLDSLKRSRCQSILSSSFTLVHRITKFFSPSSSSIPLNGQNYSK